MAPIRRSATRAAAAAPSCARAVPPRSKTSPRKAPKETTAPVEEITKLLLSSPVDSGYASDGSVYSRQGTPPSSSDDSASCASSSAGGSVRRLADEPEQIKVKAWLSLGSLIPEGSPSQRSSLDRLAPPQPPIQLTTTSPVLSPPHSPTILSSSLPALLAIFPDPVQSRICIASYFSSQLSTPALSHEAFLAELDSPPTPTGALDFGWLATLFAVVGCGALGLEERGAVVGATRSGMAEEWIAGAISLWKLAEEQQQQQQLTAETTTTPSFHALRAIVVLNGYWRNLPDGRYLRSTVDLNARVHSTYSAALTRGTFASSDDDNSSASLVGILLQALESSSNIIKLMLGTPFDCAPLPALSLAPTTGLPPPAEFLLRLHVAQALDNKNSAKVYAGLLLDSWDASSSSNADAGTVVPTDVALSYISGAFYLALDAVSNPLATGSMMNRARILAKVAKAAKSTGSAGSAVLQRGSELLGFVFMGEESVWEERRYEDLEAKVDDLAAYSPLFEVVEGEEVEGEGVKEEPADWTTFLNDV